MNACTYPLSRIWLGADVALAKYAAPHYGGHVVNGSLTNRERSHLRALPGGRLDRTNLLERLRERDPAAQAELWRDEWGRVYAVCARVLGPGADANDAAVDTLTDFMYRYADQLSQPNAIRAYLRLMAAHRAAKMRARRDRFSSDEEEQDVAGDIGGDGETRADLAWHRPRLNMCLERLSPKASQVIRLRYSEELTNERIGQLVGGSKQYIGRLLTQSLAALEKCMQRKEVGA